MDDTTEVTCESCGAGATITTHPVEGHQNVWQCPECGAQNVVEGFEGEPGEGALNPKAAHLTDDELREAYERRIASVDVSGAGAPTGEASIEET